MNIISVKDLKAHWADIERRTREGESFLVLNRGRPSARVLPAGPREVLHWDDHLKTAVKSAGRTTEKIVREDRDGRW
jgi:prevent-host-death family protein